MYIISIISIICILLVLLVLYVYLPSNCLKYGAQSVKAEISYKYNIILKDLLLWLLNDI